jgi:hypothetical protein
MKLSLLLFWFTLGSAVFAQRLPVFAPKDRVITVEQWSRTEALVWAVQPNQIVLYRMFDTLAPDELVAVRPIGPSDLKLIQDAIAKIPTDVFGKLFWHGGTLHGPMVRLNFTRDGSYIDQRIEVCGVWPEWLKAPMDSISAALPVDLRITIEDEQRKYQKRLSESGTFPPIRTLPIKEYYRPPNKAPVPTATAVTPAADAPVAPAAAAAQL